MTCGGVGTGKGGGGRRQPGKRNELPRTRRKSTTAMQEILRSNTYTMHRDPPKPTACLALPPSTPGLSHTHTQPSGVCEGYRDSHRARQRVGRIYLSSFVLLSTLPYLWCRYPTPLRPPTGNNNGLGGQTNAFVPSLQCCSFAFTSDMIHVPHPFFKLQPKTTLSLLHQGRAPETPAQSLTRPHGKLCSSGSLARHASQTCLSLARCHSWVVITETGGLPTHLDPPKTSPKGPTAKCHLANTAIPSSVLQLSAPAFQRRSRGHCPHR
ncbi:hypothetical protein BDP81DRAFT_204965 [Colletotrichum phormii]|uniref:Uncharacterized protein n=1 Tax=Colletotrichum phormii TaxID=359342 RepID=A0AAJ0EFJ6_9PEZI|nr:uncharacterized protein BDP81DRAFT_204965 [Colletotrichum phormii]KAK1638272.1 hypothetical protein BDP81DRAFT_204965 [Colletotrichum phormii]